MRQAEALRVAGNTVAAPADPPTWYLARAMATYAMAFMVVGDDASAREWAQRARAPPTARPGGSRLRR